MKKCIALILSFMMLLSITACSGDKTNQGNNSSEYKDEIIVARASDADTFDPQISNGGTSDALVMLLYSSMLKFDENGEVSPDLVIDWSVAEDQKTWTFKLREGVKFHNGKELTSEDVKATFDRAMNSEGGLRATQLIEMFEKVEAVDKYTVKITTEQPYGAMLALLCNLQIMDADYIEKYGMNIGNDVEAINGTGPYKFVSWEPDQEIVLERFDDYYGDKALTKTYKMMIIPEAASRVIALETGEVDITDIPSDEIERIKNTEGFKIEQQRSTGQRCFRFGCNDPIMSNTKVRQAILYAIDRQAIINSLYKGIAEPTTAPFTPAVWGYANLGEIKQDQAKAKALLTEAGYPNGFDTKIVTTAQYSKGTQLAEVIAAQLKEVGINATIEVLEWSTFIAITDGITADEFDAPIFIMGTGPSMRDTDNSFRGLYATSKSGLNDLNYGFYSNEELDRLAEEQMRETDPEKRKEILKRAQEIIYLEDPAAFWIYDQVITVAMSDKVEGAKVDLNGYVLPQTIKIRK